ncbi:creatininase family protein [Ensifer soli]|uniref:creatininase family protein n=1 Tax=Ciceribacter sp. sgz301302 TaxID=3342379 RepID=UPI0035B9DAD3
MNSLREDWREALAAVPRERRGRLIAVLPLGAEEQHGPHLPADTDTRIASGVAHRLKAALPAEVPALFLPVEPIGYSVEHTAWAVTKSLSYAEAIERWLGIAAELAAEGVRKFVMLNAHGGNAPLMTIVATEARLRFKMLAVATSWTRFGQPDGWIAPADKAIDIHAGDIETSVMLALDPDRVDRTKARAFPSRQAEFAARFRHLRAYGPHAFGWTMGDLNPDGAAGDATRATAEKGERLLAHAVAGLVELMQDIDGFDPAVFDGAASPSWTSPAKLPI